MERRCNVCGRKLLEFIKDVGNRLFLYRCKHCGTEKFYKERKKPLPEPKPVVN